jgi:drug/metabolite transporter (DMT)-like permease
VNRTIDAKTAVAIALTLILWASAFAGIKVGLGGYGPGELALLRFGVASAALAVYATITRMRLPDARDLPRLALAGILGITVYHVALNFGERSVSAGAASLIIAAGPVFTALLAALVLGERLTAWGWSGIAIAFSGVALITLGEGGGGLHLEPGAVLVMLSAVATACYFIVAKPLLSRYGSLEFTTYAIWAGTIPMLLWAGPLVRQMGHATAEQTGAVIYLGLFPAALAYVAWSYALKRMEAAVLSSFLYLSPVAAIGIAFVWIHEVPSLLSLIGGAIAVVGVVLVNTKGKARPVKRPAAA